MERTAKSEHRWLSTVLVVIGTALLLNLLADIALNIMVGFKGALGLLLQFFTVTWIASLGLTYIWRGSGYLRRVLKDAWPRIVLDPSRNLEPNTGIWYGISDQLITHAHVGYRKYSIDEIHTAFRNAAVIIAYSIILQSLTFGLLIVLQNSGQLEGLAPVVTESRGLLIGFIAIFSPLIGAFTLGLSIVSGSGTQEVILLILILPFSLLLTPAAGNIISIFEALNSAFIQGVARLIGEGEVTLTLIGVYMMLVGLLYILAEIFTFI